MRIALYGGTFDPIHHGHLILARDALELLPVDRVVFIPAAISPHKLETAPSPPEIRRAMVAAAIAGEDRFGLDERELRRPGPSYTVETVEEYRREQPEAQLFYLLGTDNLAALESWHRIADLRGLVQFIILRRRADGPATAPALERRLDISSTEVRARIAQAASIRYLVPEPVRDLIESHHLYRARQPGS